MQQENAHSAAVARTARVRVRFADYAFNRSPAGRAHVKIELEHNAKRFIGEAQGVSSPTTDLRLGADAALQALQRFLGSGVSFELGGVKLVRAFDADVAIVSVKARGTIGDMLVGCCLADRDPVRASALAVLNATNRVVENCIVDSRLGQSA
jgi:hypothetical protein